MNPQTSGAESGMMIRCMQASAVVLFAGMLSSCSPIVSSHTCNEAMIAYEDLVAYERSRASSEAVLQEKHRESGRVVPLLPRPDLRSDEEQAAALEAIRAANDDLRRNCGADTAKEWRDTLWGAETANGAVRTDPPSDRMRPP